MLKKNERNKIKSIIIVHNLAQYRKKMEVENHIKQYLYKSANFKLDSKKYLGNNKIFEDREFLFEISDESKDLQIYHYIMPKEGTKAGDYYNPFALELIKQQYNSFKDRKAIIIPVEIIKYFQNYLLILLEKRWICKKSIII